MERARKRQKRGRERDRDRERERGQGPFSRSAIWEEEGYVGHCTVGHVTTLPPDFEIFPCKRAVQNSSASIQCKNATQQCDANNINAKAQCIINISQNVQAAQLQHCCSHVTGIMYNVVCLQCPCSLAPALLFSCHRYNI